MQMRHKDSDTSILNVLLINPNAMSKVESKLVKAFIESSMQLGKNIFFSDKRYSLDVVFDPTKLDADTQQLLRQHDLIKFTYMLIPRYSAMHKNDLRIDVYGGNQINAVHSSLQQIIGVLKPANNGELTFKLKNNRVAKRWDKSQEEAYKEYHYTKQVKALHVKKPVSVMVQNLSFSALMNGDPLSIPQNVMVMRYVQGNDLSRIIQKDRDKAFLSLQQRVELSRQLILAMQKQLNANSIVHRDLVARNIRVNMKATPPEVTFIDFGESTSPDAEQNLKRCYGTPLFMPPEELDGKQVGLTSNIYGLGWVLAMLWHADAHPATEVIEDNPGYVGAIDMASRFTAYAVNTLIVKTAHDCQFKHLFSDLSGLSWKHKKAIDTILQQTVTVDPKDRCSVEQLLTVFDEIAFSLKEKELPRKERVDLQIAYNHGVDLRNQLQFIGFNHSDVGERVKQSIKAIQAILNEIPDKPACISEVMERADIKVLAGMTTKHEVFSKLNSMQYDFARVYGDFKRAKVQLSKQIKLNPICEESKELQSYMDRVEEKYLQIQDVNQIPTSISRLYKHNGRFNQQLDQLCSENVTGPSLHR